MEIHRKEYTKRMDSEYEDGVMGLLKSFFAQYDAADLQKRSYNFFLTHRLAKIIEEEPQIEVMLKKNEFFRVEFGQVFVDRPYIVDEKRAIQYILPSEALLRDLTYSSSLSINIFTRHYTVSEEDGSETVLEEKSYVKIPIARIPIMVGCSKCNLSLLSKKERIARGHCANDSGGYFIIKGKERVLVAQERTNYNMVYIFEKKNTDQKHLMVAEIRSMSEETGHSVLIQMKICVNSKRIMVGLPFISQDVPLGFVFVAYGCDIPTIDAILRKNIDIKNPEIEMMIKSIIKDAMIIQNEETAIHHIAQFATHVVSRERRIMYVKQILMNEVFPHLGISSGEMHKILFLGHMCGKMLLTYAGVRPLDDRDHLSNKRVEVAGVLVGDLFRTLWKRFIRTIVPQLIKRLDILTIISKLNVITMGLRHCFSTGNWGIPKSNYIRTGVSQVLSRMSYNSTLSHLRRIVIPIGKEGRNTKIRQVHPTQIGFICSSETPEGSSAGIVKNFSLISEVSTGVDPIFMRMILEKLPGIETDFKKFMDRTPWIKVFLNGNWMGLIGDGEEAYRRLEYLKNQQKLIPMHVSFTLEENELRVYCDEGRMIRPFFIASRMPSLAELKERDWDGLVRRGSIVWMDSHELEQKVVAMFPRDITMDHDLCEIHPCLMLGICASLMPFADHTQSPRICYHSSMVKQSIGIYSGTNEVRADTVAHLLSYPEKPIVRSHVEEWLNLDKLPCGNNVIVAIACYGGWNQEDSIILNKSSVDRGLFRSFTYRTLMVEEKKKTSSHMETIDMPPLESRIRSFNYSKLDPRGIVCSGVYVGSGDVIVAKTSVRQIKMGREEKLDTSVVIKNGEEGYVDKVFVTTTPDGYKMVKIKIRAIKIPEVGDKLCSNCAQKGTIGMTLSREDMPFTPDGIVPDIIINPLCFAAETRVQCHDGLSRRMDMILDQTDSVWCLDMDLGAVISSPSMGGEAKVMQAMVRLVRSDGVVVRCTPDHEFLILETDGSRRWCRADHIRIGEDRIVTGMRLPEDRAEWNEFWRYELNGMVFRVDTEKERRLAMSFFRAAGIHASFAVPLNAMDHKSIEKDTDLFLDKDFTLFMKRLDDLSSSRMPSCLVREFIAAFLSMHLDIQNDQLCFETMDFEMVGRIARLIVLRFDILCTASQRIHENRARLVIRDPLAFIEKIGVRYHPLNSLRLSVLASFLRSRSQNFDGFLKESGASGWYHHHHQEQKEALPFYTTRLSERIQEEEEEMTYCIGVQTHHNFLAESMVVRNCIPSRMTINQLMESIGAKSAVMQGRYRRATTFSSHSVNIVDTLKQELHDCGYEKNGTERMINGMTGKPMDADIFIGPCYYHRLKHLVSAKIHARNHGKVSQLTHQPLEGRSRDGGLRFGEMERDCCSGELDISLKCCLSIKLKTMAAMSENVLGWDEEKRGMRPSRKIGFLNKGVRDCVEITLQDGRTIRCTPDHPMLTSDNQWVLAKDLVSGTSRLRVSVHYPSADIEKEYQECNGWSFSHENIRLKTDSVYEYMRSMAFMRILGWIVTDGGLYQCGSKIRGSISLGHSVDVDSFLEDLRYFCGDDLYRSDASRFLKTCVSSHGTAWSHYNIQLPYVFSEDIATMDGMMVGKKVCQEAQLPAFVLDADFPQPLLREFLGGLFGGDGHTCILSMHRGKRDVMTSISFSKSRTKAHVKSLVSMMENLKYLLARCGIHTTTIQALKETSHSKDVAMNEDEKCFQSTLHLDISELIPFWEKIGFRHCAHKSLRLEAGASYKRLREVVAKQHNWLVHRVDEITNFSEIKRQNPTKIVGTKKAIIQAVKELCERETLVHSYAIPATHDMTDHLIKGTTFGKFASKGFPNAEDFFKDVGAFEWFIENDESKNISGRTCYAIKTESDVLPTMAMTVIGIRPCGQEEVYDIEVEGTHSFLANGIVAHNCMISHGNSRFLLERLFDMSDPFRIPICSDCGAMPSSNSYCSVCEGTDVVIVPMPYACKLLFQELNAMGLRINLFPEKDCVQSSSLLSSSLPQITSI